jgi:hypothetical protein
MSGQRHAPAALYPRERYGTHCTEGWVGSIYHNILKGWDSLAFGKVKYMKQRLLISVQYFRKKKPLSLQKRLSFESKFIS